MALIDHIDGAARRIYLTIDSVGVEVQPMDIYLEMRALRRTDLSLRKFDVFLRGLGKVPKTPGKYTERFVQEVTDDLNSITTKKTRHIYLAISKKR